MEKRKTNEHTEKMLKKWAPHGKRKKKLMDIMKNTKKTIDKKGENPWKL